MIDFPQCQKSNSNVKVGWDMQNIKKKPWTTLFICINVPFKYILKYQNIAGIPPVNWVKELIRVDSCVVYSLNYSV